MCVVLLLLFAAPSLIQFRWLNSISIFMTRKEKNKTGIKFILQICVDSKQLKHPLYVLAWVVTAAFFVVVALQSIAIFFFYLISIFILIEDIIITSGELTGEEWKKNAHTG